MCTSISSLPCYCSNTFVMFSAAHESADILIIIYHPTAPQSVTPWPLRMRYIGFIKTFIILLINQIQKSKDEVKVCQLKETEQLLANLLFDQRYHKRHASSLVPEQESSNSSPHPFLPVCLLYQTADLSMANSKLALPLIQGVAILVSLGNVRV